MFITEAEATYQKRRLRKYPEGEPRASRTRAEYGRARKQYAPNAGIAESTRIWATTLHDC